MHSRRSRRRKSHNPLKITLIILLILVLVCGAAFAVWYFWPYKTSHDVPSATAPSGTLKGLSVHTVDGSAFAKNALTFEQQKYLDDAVDFAIDSGINAIFVDVIEDGDEPKVLYRDRGFGALGAFDALSQNDTILNYFTRFDPLKYICKSASDADIAVYAVADVKFKDDENVQKSFARMNKKYAVAGVYYCDTALGNLTDEDGKQLAYTAESAWSISSTDLFAASVKEGFAGAVIDDIEKARENAEVFGMMLASLNSVPQSYALLSYTPVTALGITYPADGAKIYTSTCFVMGTSDPASPLVLNGAEVTRTSASGIFGTLVTLEEGENTLEFKNGTQTLSYKITRPAPASSSGSGAKTEIPHDATVEVDEGTAVRVNKTIATLLYDPSNDGNINETARNGATARVVACIETVRSGKKTWAYQLDSGDYVLAYNTQKMSDDYKDASFTGASAAATETGETITFTGEGQPLMYTNTKDNALILHLYNATLPADFKIDGSAMVTSTQVTQNEKYAELVLNFASPLWGYTVVYNNEKTTLYLNNTPKISDNTEKPLENVSVLLDPGHGDNDSGAMGTAGNGSPVEKDVNFAVAQAAKFRLEQLGAKVTMTREADTFLELAERNDMITTVQPDYFISVHHNSIDLSVDANSSKGTECYYFFDNAKTLAESLVTDLTAATGRQSRGAFWGYYYVTRNTTARAVLLECGFMVNPLEYENVTDNDVVWREGYAIAQAIYENVKAG
jgi:N-acetylmuramoyl-L-alanine amidase